MTGGFAAVRDGPLRLLGLLTNIRQHSTRVVDTVTNRRLLVFAALCLVIVASRVSRLSTLEMDRDEVWSVWQTFGTPAQIMSWTPSDWPPLYYLLLGAWRGLAGFDPFTVRVLSLLFFLPGMAILYRIGSKLFTETAALIAVAACAAMGFIIHISVTVRAYSLIFTLVMLAWWLALLYFEKPSTRRGVALGACIVALFYTHFTTAFAAIVIDPGVPVAAEEWDYFTRAYFPHGLEWIQTPEGNRHIWYFSLDNQENSTIYARLQQDWVAGASFHFGEYTLRLYEQPADLNGILFENGMRFNGVEVVDQPGPVPVFREGQTVHLRLWWSIDRAMTLDYSVGTYVFDQTGMIAQVDGPPQVQASPHETSRWISGRYYVEDREITLPSSMISGSYSVRLSVYQWWDNKRLSAPGIDADTLLRILTFQVRAW